MMGLTNDIKPKTNFENLTEENKLGRALNYALMHCQSFLFQTPNLPEIEEYKNEIKATIDWLSEKLHLSDMTLY